MKFSFTHLLVGTLVSDRKLFLTERREARICANGVTMRSSPWLQDQTREGSVLFYFSPMRQAWYNEGRINGRTFRLAMNSNVYSIIVFPKSCALNNSCRRVAFSMYGCKLYTIYYYYSLRYTLFLFLSSSIQFQFYFSSGMEKDGEKIKSKLKGRKKKQRRQNCVKHWCLLRISRILKRKILKEERGEKFHRLQFSKKKDIPSILWNSKKSLEIIQLSQSKIYL